MRLCFVGDPDSIHVQRWAGYFAGRGHEVHLVSFYPPRAPLEGVRTHALYSRPPEGWLWRRVAGRGEGTGPSASLRTGGGRRRSQGGAYGMVPPSLARLVTWSRYRWQGIERLVGDIRPDVLHGHYITDYALYATAARFHPFVATAWGSDILIAAQGSPLGRAIARYVLGKADLITADSDQVIARMRELGGAQKEVVKIVLGVNRSFVEAAEGSVNRPGGRPSGRRKGPRQAGPLVISLRSLD
ncbi:MAG: glycosyltransferase, partial [Chloroflexota bacterium]|nr:glycosyltransferase [Chloroflexota bacterium]